ncbi:MAG TPA: TRAP transporter small permease [Candidatus Binatia bacterium]|nr:TRAP transporter small permease [Candidatus Binatia bacterium]
MAWTRRLALLAGWLLLAIALATVADALLRSLAGRPVPGAFEATELLLGAVIFFGLPYTSLTDGHVSVDLLVGRLGPRGRHLVIAGAALTSAVLLALLTAQMADLAREYALTRRTTITARIPVLPFILPVTAAGGLASLGFLGQTVGALARVVWPNLPPLPGTEPGTPDP